MPRSSRSGNFSAVDAYEPGSVGKIITVAGALKDGAVTPDRYFTVPWQYDCTNDTSNGILSDSHQHDVEQLIERHGDHRRVLQHRHDH